MTSFTRINNIEDRHAFAREVRTWTAAKVEEALLDAVAIYADVDRLASVYAATEDELNEASERYEVLAKEADRRKACKAAEGRQIARHSLARPDGGCAPGCNWGTVLFFVDVEQDHARVVWMDGHNTVRTVHSTVAEARTLWVTARQQLGSPVAGTIQVPAYLASR